MNHPHPPVTRGLAADRIAAAPRRSAHGSRTRRAAAALVLLLACAGAAPAACPGTDGSAGEPACPADAAAPPARDAASAVPAPPPGAAATAAAADGQRELATAKKLIDDGEAATTDDDRKRAYEEAKRHADRAVELMPTDADARFVQFAAEGRIAQLGGIAVAALQLVKLNKQLDEVLRLDPNHANALAARGGMLMKLPRLFGGNTTKGVEYLEKAVALDSTAIGKRLELAEAYHIVGREDDAKNTAQSALEVAKQLNEPDRVATCERFIVELQKSCSGCAVASIGR
jgi:tetratricopeptide (TPR) repeat protein